MIRLKIVLVKQMQTKVFDSLSLKRSNSLFCLQYFKKKSCYLLLAFFSLKKGGEGGTHLSFIKLNFRLPDPTVHESVISEGELQVCLPFPLS